MPTNRRQQSSNLLGANKYLNAFYDGNLYTFQQQSTAPVAPADAFESNIAVKRRINVIFLPRVTFLFIFIACLVRFTFTVTDRPEKKSLASSCTAGILIKNVQDKINKLHCKILKYLQTKDNTVLASHASFKNIQIHFKGRCLRLKDNPSVDALSLLSNRKHVAV